MKKGDFLVKLYARGLTDIIKPPITPRNNLSNYFTGISYYLQFIKQRYNESLLQKLRILKKGIINSGEKLQKTIIMRPP